jgi:hypothetical protein
MFTEEQTKEIVEMKSHVKAVLEQHFYPIINESVASFKNFFVSGGCFASLLQDKTPQDYDLYCLSKVDGDAFKDYLLNDGLKHVESVNPSYGGALLVDGKLVTGNAITMNYGIQFITRDIGVDARDQFDYEHCMPFYELGSDKLYISELQYYLCKNKLLKLREGMKSDDKREKKFLNRGYKLWQ